MEEPAKPPKKTAKATKKKPKKKSHRKVVLRGNGLPGNTSDKVDRGLLHEYLWKKADPRSHRVTMQQVELAAGLQITPFAMTRIFAEMLASGRLRRVRGVYYVVDPNVWRWRDASPEVPWQ